MKNLSTELFIRNLESEYAANHVAKVPPQLAVFWIEETGTGYNLRGVSCPLRHGELLQGVKVHGENHYAIWGKIQREFPAWIGLNYMSVPRGRISYVATDIENPYFLIYLPPQYEGNVALERAVINTYSLPASFCTFEYHDIHYKTRTK